MNRDEAVRKLYALIRELGEQGWVLRVVNGKNLAVESVESSPPTDSLPPPPPVSPQLLVRPEPVSRTGSVCVRCGSSQMIMMGGCETCANCGESVGGCT